MESEQSFPNKTFLLHSFDAVFHYYPTQNIKQVLGTARIFCYGLCGVFFWLGFEIKMSASVDFKTITFDVVFEI